MALKPPLMDLPIATAEKGFYRGFSIDVTIASKVIISAIVVWAIFWPTQSGSVLNGLNSFILANFAAWYIYCVAFFILVCLGLALWPTAGRMNLGLEGDKPEFTNFSWFSMMFGAGIGVGMLTWAVAEPVSHFASNPETIQGLSTGGDADNVRNAYKWSFLHWGFGAWACYAVCGLSLAFFSYRRGLPLTIRSGLTPLFGTALSGVLGTVIDIVAVVATILGVAQTLGFGVDQFVAGLTRIGIGGLTDDTGGASTFGIIVALLIIMGASTLSALSGVGKGIKWLSNINMVLSIILLSFFIIFGATWFGFNAMFVGLWDYVTALPGMSFNVFKSDGVEGSEAFLLAQWQGWWPVFYWAWWIAFAPFVGLFLARISRGRTIREFVLGALIVPALMCFVWFAWAGGTAIDLELNGGANGVIFDAANGDKIFAMTEFMLAPINVWLAWGMALLIVVLLMTFLVTSADSAVLIVNTINAAGDEGPKSRPHILFWGAALGLVVAGLLISGGTSAIQTAMVIGALPFSLVMVLMCVSLIKAIYNDGRREAAGVATLTDPDEAFVAPAE
ncbi:BCCT family transporter [Sulfitobacter guttiformis]|uniref:Choline/carnitine/betaine transport n=1 Tax=Sulfitobacter guttiformis TaxID=74349 RepID=A0A420DHN7_9RHOB|nr:BCCT family transporter [Sulfitobacter guttiformis]KIN72515.1 Glycine betaine transporter [Sulfitobacter guttiformis KCTC 32187]RKE93738.1 choline/carnitine/betaine transport [Sulfitobacter guttiformis]